MNKIEGKFKEVFSLALNELGLSEQFLIRLAEQLSDRRYVLEDFYQEMDVDLFKKLCEALCLEIEMFSNGYDRTTHHFNIIKSLQHNNFVLPRTKELKKIIG